jgi:hypothetical protein
MDSVGHDGASHEDAVETLPDHAVSPEIMEP